MNNLLQEDTICALATGGGLSAIAVIRLSGKEAIKITNTIFEITFKNYMIRILKGFPNFA